MVQRNARDRYDLILFVGSYLDSQRDAIKKLNEQLEKNPVKPIVIVDSTDINARKSLAHDNKLIVVESDFMSSANIEKALKPYKDQIIAMTCRAERNIPLLKKVIPHVPYVHSPTEMSLDWTTNKITMRNMLENYDKSISPKFLVVHDASEFTLDRIEKKVGFPLMIKPAGLAASLLVTLCYHREELEKYLQNTVSKIDQIYKKKKGRGQPEILVEEFMEGTMFSIDSYVNARGVTYHAPLVHVKTGRSVGFEDFFGYIRMTPVRLKDYKIDNARHTVDKVIEALNLRSTTCHTELMKTEDGWKVIEAGPRIGGFRHEMYALSYGMDHSLNDIKIRIPRKPVIPKKAKGYTAVMQFYARHKGYLHSLSGINKIRRLDSFSRIEIKKKVGDMCDFARNGDDPVFDIVLFNTNRSDLLADIRRLEQTVKIVVKQRNRGKTVGKLVS